MSWGRCERVSLFVNAYKVMSWVLGGANQLNEQEGGRGKLERVDSR